MSDRFRARYGPWAVVAGASEGLGAEFARQIAAHGVNLLLIARRQDALDALAAQLRAKFPVAIRTASIDLARPDLADAVTAAAAGLEVGLVIYNAAYSLIGEFLDQDLDQKLRILDVNCRGPVILAHVFGGAMAERKRGGMIFMSSLAASQGSPMVATYAATKAFNLILGESLWEELGRRGVDVMACRAGATRTPAYLASQPKVDAPLMDARPVVKSALASLGRGPSSVPGWLNRVVAFVLGRLLSRRLAIRIIGGATRRMYE